MLHRISAQRSRDCRVNWVPLLLSLRWFFSGDTCIHESRPTCRRVPSVIYVVEWYWKTARGFTAWKAGVLGCCFNWSLYDESSVRQDTPRRKLCPGYGGSNQMIPGEDVRRRCNGTSKNSLFSCPGHPPSVLLRESSSLLRKSSSTAGYVRAAIKLVLGISPCYRGYSRVC